MDRQSCLLILGTARSSHVRGVHPLLRASTDWCNAICSFLRSSANPLPFAANLHGACEPRETLTRHRCFAGLSAVDSCPECKGLFSAGSLRCPWLASETIPEPEQCQKYLEIQEVRYSDEPPNKPIQSKKPPAPL